jgi:hypothetical protein
MALGGLAALLAVLALPPPFGQPAPRWAWRFFAAWCVGVPYWHWLEWRLLRDPAAPETALREFADAQALSRCVWLGGAVVLAVALLTGARPG